MLFTVHDSASFYVMTGNYDRVDHIDPEQVNEPPKVHIVALSNAVRDKWAMMIEHFNAVIASTTMDGALRSEYLTRVAEFQPSNVSFLTIESIHHQIVLECASELLDVIIFNLFWDKTRI